MNKKIWITVALILSMVCIAIGAFGEVEPGRSPVPTCTFVGYTSQPACGNYGYTGSSSTCPPSSTVNRVTQSTAAAAKCTSVINNNCLSIINCPTNNSSATSNCKTTGTVATTAAKPATTQTTCTVPTSCGTITYYYSAPSSCSYSISFR